MSVTENLEPVAKLKRDTRAAAATLSASEARFLVDLYYIQQNQRKRNDNQVRALTETGEPHAVLEHVAAQSRALENQVKSALNAYSAAHPVGQWARSQIGIGPVIAAGLLAHIDITKAPTVGHIWSYAGQNPNAKWGKGQKRPWNGELKKLCWIIGESFVKVSGNEDAYYGAVYVKRKALEIERNEAGQFADQAARALSENNYKKDTESYKAYIKGKLPPAQLHARAKRYAMKLFLSHLHDVWFREEFGEAPPLPYPIAHGEHVHYLPPPTTKAERTNPSE